MAPFEATPDDVDFDLLGKYLKALANARRLELLYALRLPAKASEVELKPARRDTLSPERSVSRQTVSTHLARLENVGVLSRVPAHDGGADRWVTNVPHVFAIVEELRKLTAIPSPDALDVDPDETVAHDTHRPAHGFTEGPKLIVLTGPWEGRAFPLAGPGPWSIGRSRSRVIPLAYDPFVSVTHAIVDRDGDGFALHVDKGARNGARVNFREVPAGERVHFTHGDAIGIGRSLLLFHSR